MHLRSGKKTRTHANELGKNPMVVLRRLKSTAINFGDKKAGEKMIRTPGHNKGGQEKIPSGVEVLPVPLQGVVSRTIQNNQKKRVPSPITSEQELQGAAALPQSSDRNTEKTFHLLDTRNPPLNTRVNSPGQHIKGPQPKRDMLATKPLFEQFIPLDDDNIREVAQDIEQELSYRKMPSERYTGTVPKGSRVSIEPEGPKNFYPRYSEEQRAKNLQAFDTTLEDIRKGVLELKQNMANASIGSPEIMTQLRNQRSSSPQNNMGGNNDAISANLNYMPNVLNHQNPNTNRAAQDLPNQNQPMFGQQSQPNRLNPLMQNMQGFDQLGSNTYSQFPNQMYHQFNQFNPMNQMMGQLMSQYMNPFMQFNQGPFWPNPNNQFQNFQQNPQQFGQYNLSRGAPQVNNSDGNQRNEASINMRVNNGRDENSRNTQERLRGSLCRDSFMEYLKNIPLFSGQSREDLMNFIEICDTINSFATNDSEYVEFITKITFQLRGEARSVLSDDIEWMNIKDRLLSKFSYLSNRNVLDSQIENLRQERDESLIKYAERARKLLIEKNKSFHCLTEEQRAEHDRIARRFFARGISNQKLRDILVVQSSPSLEESISRSLEIDNEISSNVSRREFFCTYCKTIGHRINECKAKENDNTPLGQLASALKNLKIQGSNNQFNKGNNFNRSYQNPRQNGNNWNNDRNNSSNRPNNGGNQSNYRGQNSSNFNRNYSNGNNNGRNNSNNSGNNRGNSNGSNNSTNANRPNTGGGGSGNNYNNDGRGYNNNQQNVRLLSQPDELNGESYDDSYENSEN